MYCGVELAEGRNVLSTLTAPPFPRVPLKGILVVVVGGSSLFGLACKVGKRRLREGGLRSALCMFQVGAAFFGLLRELAV